MKVANKSKNALDQGKGSLSTEYWDQTEEIVTQVTSGVNIYNILDWNSPLYQQYLSSFNSKFD